MVLLSNTADDETDVGSEDTSDTEDDVDEEDWEDPGTGSDAAAADDDDDNDEDELKEIFIRLLRLLPLPGCHLSGLTNPASSEMEVSCDW